MTNSHRSRPGDDKVMMMYMEEGVKRKKKKKQPESGAGGNTRVGCSALLIERPGDWCGLDCELCGTFPFQALSGG